jgi:dTMP kinase
MLHEARPSKRKVSWGVFVSFEGPEGAGKSTVIATVAQALTADGWDVLVTREPGDGPVGAEIRKVLLHGETLDSKAELLLFLADRAQHVADIVRPALEGGRTVLCDRYADSTVVYQGCARGLDRQTLRNWNAFATGGLMPDLTLLLDLPAEVGLSRVQNKDRLDSEPLDFHRKVRQGFLDEAAADPGRWRVLDATQPVDDVVKQALAAIRGG